MQKESECYFLDSFGAYMNVGTMDRCHILTSIVGLSHAAAAFFLTSGFIWDLCILEELEKYRHSCTTKYNPVSAPVSKANLGAVPHHSTFSDLETTEMD